MEDFLDKVLPRMSEEEQSQFLEEILEIADRDSREQAIIDPISLWTAQSN
jgi:succinate dehydrogenase flavin-adding protein (antitoxin of CptAB toxin-antitoxin module)